ncbi:MAG: GNAT family N-acetyltransferase [Thermaerobacter sp.]|nr:GNAT family N-acetyltransferase [Thermaerobacter sp.]
MANVQHCGGGIIHAIRTLRGSAGVPHGCAVAPAALRSGDNLLFGILANLTAAAAEPDPPPYLALYRSEDGIAGAAIRTPPLNLLLSYGAAPRALHAFAADPHPQGPRPARCAEREADRACLRGDLATRARTWNELPMAERIYELTGLVPPAPTAGRVRPAVASDADLLLSWVRDFTKESLGSGADRTLERAQRTVAARLRAGPTAGGFYRWEDQEPVSLAGFAGPTPSGIRIGPMYTPPHLRRRGYASALVATLSDHLLALGRERIFLLYRSVESYVECHLPAHRLPGRVRRRPVPLPLNRIPKRARRRTAGPLHQSRFRERA